MEPGCYFISALLIPAMENSDTSKFFNPDTIRRFMVFGGVRIESDVVLYNFLIIPDFVCYSLVKNPMIISCINDDVLYIQYLRTNIMRLLTSDKVDIMSQ